jgi:RNA polymerase sigma factor (sigma-70 family)
VPDRSDVDLLDAWRAGDGDAGEQLFDRHFPAIGRFFRSKLNDGIEDIVQRTFLIALEKRDQLREDASFRAFLFGIARGELFNQYRRRAKDAERLDFGVSSLADIDPSPSVHMAKQQEHRLLLRALRRIPLEFQLTLELFYWEKMSGPELATALGVPEGTARSRLRRGRELLEAELAAVARDPSMLKTTVDGLDKWAASLREVFDGSAV